MSRLLRDQWAALRASLDAAELRRHADPPTGLGDFCEMSGRAPGEPDAMAWIRAAARRVPSDDPHPPLL